MDSSLSFSTSETLFSHLKCLNGKRDIPLLPFPPLQVFWDKAYSHLSFCYQLTSIFPKWKQRKPVILVTAEAGHYLHQKQFHFQEQYQAGYQLECQKDQKMLLYEYHLFTENLDFVSDNDGNSKKVKAKKKKKALLSGKKAG